LLKGRPLAYTIYPQAYLRPRGDTDVLVPERQRGLAHEVLLDAGYAAETTDARELAAYQRSYTHEDRAGLQHSIDLHWRLSNRQIFSRMFSFDELRASAEPVGALGAGAMTLSPVHAMLLACLHRVTHINAPYFVAGVRYLEANRLIWLYDIHLLASGFSDADWARLVELATAKQLRAVCADGLRATAANLGTPIPRQVMESLAAAGLSEPAAAYLRRGFWRLSLLAELPALTTWSERARLVGEWAFPPTEHMFAKYGLRRRWLLPYLYVHRAVAGVVKAVSARPR
jgi:hypothetical protein